jgi:chitinase
MRMPSKGTLAATAAVLLVPLGVLTVNAANGTAAPMVTPAATGFGVAPYVDMTNNQEPMLNAAISSGGLKAFTAAFVIGSGCTAIWGDTLPVTNDPTVSGDISSAQSAGAQVIVSFGGAGGVELAQSCTNTASLQAAYQSVINQYHLSHVDFDIEGAAIADPTTINRRFAAIKGLESANPGLVVSVTVPVLPTGLDGNGTAFIQDAKNDGARLDLVNIMTMDFGGSFDNNPNMGADATQAAQATLNQIRGPFPSMGFGNIGITPMIGVNDDSAEVFSEANASSVVSFANANGIGRLAFWSVDRDQPCGGSINGLPVCSEISQAKLDFTKIFNGFSGGGGTPPPPPPPNGKQITGIGGKCVDVAGANSADGTKIQIFTCNGTAAQSWTHTGSTYQALGKCLDVAAAGTANGTKVQLFTCNGTGAQSWTHTASNQLVNANSGKCLDATGVSSADGTPLQIWTCSGGTNQAWVGP